jgi:hypothetical protein
MRHIGLNPANPTSRVNHTVWTVMDEKLTSCPKVSQIQFFAAGRKYFPPSGGGMLLDIAPDHPRAASEQELL